MGFLRDDIELFVKTKSAEVLRMIYEKHGKRGFSLACRAAGIKRGQGKRMIGIYNDAGVIEQLAARCGLRKTDYFVRFILTPPQARRDLRRGYSFSGYTFFSTKKEAREFWQEMGVSDPDLGRCDQGWGLKLPGLCGFGPFETVEEAEEFARANRGYGDGAGAWPCAAIYTGSYICQADSGDGDVFRPRQLVKVINF